MPFRVDLDTFTTRRIPDWLRERLAPVVEDELAALGGSAKGLRSIPRRRPRKPG